MSVFLPLGQWGARDWEGDKQEEEEDKLQASLVGVLGGWLGEGELQLLRVAFATVAAGRDFDDGTVSLTELRAASTQLDGMEPPEEPVRKALQVKGSTCTFKVR